MHYVLHVRTHTHTHTHIHTYSYTRMYSHMYMPANSQMSPLSLSPSLSLSLSLSHTHREHPRLGFVGHLRVVFEDIVQVIVVTLELVVLLPGPLLATWHGRLAECRERSMQMKQPIHQSVTQSVSQSVCPFRPSVCLSVQSSISTHSLQTWAG